MRSLVLAACLQLTTAAHAGVEGELSAGATAQSELGAAARTSFALANGRILVQRAREPRPAEERGLHACEGKGCWWFFTSVDPDDIDGIGGEATARLLYATTGDAAHDLQLDGRTWAGIAGWRIEGRSTFQPSMTLRERFWRSNRDVLQSNLAVSIPAWLSLDFLPGIRLSTFSWTVDVGTRAQRDDAGWHGIGTDVEIALRGARFDSEHATVDLGAVRYADLSAADRRLGAVTFGTRAVALDADAFAVEARLQPYVAISGRLGFAPFLMVDEAETGSVGDGLGAAAWNYWLEARFGDHGGEPTSLAAVAGAGTWLRLDPSGHAVDAGQLASTSVILRRKRLTIRAELQLGRLRRERRDSSAPPGVAPVGTRMVMGRAAVQATYAITKSLSIHGGSWLEHSDRDDPLWIAASREPASHAGGDLSAVWMFRRDGNRR